MNNGLYKYVKSPRHAIPEDLKKTLKFSPRPGSGRCHCGHSTSWGSVEREQRSAWTSSSAPRCSRARRSPSLWHVGEEWESCEESDVKIKTQYLNHHPVGQSLVGVHLPDFSVAVTEVQLKVDTFTTISGCSQSCNNLHYFLMDFLLSIYGCSFSILSILQFLKELIE